MECENLTPPIRVSFSFFESMNIQIANREGRKFIFRKNAQDINIILL